MIFTVTFKITLYFGSIWDAFHWLKIFKSTLLLCKKKKEVISVSFDFACPKALGKNKQTTPTNKNLLFPSSLNKSPGFLQWESPVKSCPTLTHSTNLLFQVLSLLLLLSSSNTNTLPFSLHMFLPPFSSRKTGIYPSIQALDDLWDL